MSGAYFVVDTIDDIGIPNYINHWHVELELQSGKKLIYSDIRRFGEMRLAKHLEDAAQIMAIAPEPFEEGSGRLFHQTAQAEEVAAEENQGSGHESQCDQWLRQYLCV